MSNDTDIKHGNSSKSKSSKKRKDITEDRSSRNTRKKSISMS